MGLSSWVVSGLTGLFVLTGAIMVFFILLQEGKGGGLTALGGTKAAGVEGVTNPIRRATVYLAVLFFSLAVILGILSKPKVAARIGPGTPSPAVTSPAPAANTFPAEAKPIEIKVPEAKTGETKTEAGKKDESKTAEPKKDEAKTIAEPKKEEAKKDEAKKDDAKKDDEKKAN